MKSKTIVLIHGLWMTPESWDLFKEYFQRRDYQVLTPAWPHMEGSVASIRQHPELIAGLGIQEIADHFEQFVRALKEPPILMGHSIGGLIVQILLDRGVGAAGVAIDSVAPRGVFKTPLSTLKATSPILLHPHNYNSTVELTFEQFRYAFANTMTEEQAQEAYEKYCVPGPGRPLFQTALANFEFHAATAVNYDNHLRAPLLLIAGDEDNIEPASVNFSNFKMYKDSQALTEYKEFPGRSHLIIAQEGWEEVAEFAIDWAEQAQDQLPIEERWDHVGPASQPLAVSETIAP
jgi:pimeloyl-ACP methyl ester carboxylesterase